MISIILMAISASANPELFRAQQSWPEVEAQTYDGQTVVARLTPHQKLRVSSWPQPQKVIQWKIESATFTNMRQRWKFWCDFHEGIYDTYRSEPIRLIGPIPKLQYTKSLQYDSEWLEVENPPTIFHHTLHLKLSDQSRTVQFGRLEPSNLEKELNDSLSDSIQQSGGEIQIELPGWTELACDLISGEATITLDVDVGHDEAILMQEQWITTDQAQSLFQTLVKLNTGLPEWSGPRRWIIAGLLVNEVLHRFPQISTQAKRLHLKALVDQLFDPNTAEIRNDFSAQRLVDETSQYQLPFHRHWLHYKVGFQWVD